MNWKHPKGIYYGWVIVALGLVSMSFWFGIRSSFSVFYVTLLEEFHWSRGESAGVQSTALLTYTVLAPLVGGLIDRLGPRRVIVPGIVVLVAGLALYASIRTLFDFYLFYGIVEAGIGLGGALGAYAAGFIFDRTGNYRMAFAVAMAAALLSVLTMWVAAPRKARPLRRRAM